MCYDRKIMYKILLTLFVLLISFTNVKADDCRGDRPQYDEDGTLIIYICKSFIRNSSDLTHKTYSYEVVSADKEEIQKVSSLNVVQSGPDGQLTSTFMRGTNSNHTLITLNGIAIQDHSTPNGTEDLFAHSFLGVDRVEVIKGPMGSIYGPNAIGGVINMVTQANGLNYIELSGGSFGQKTQIIKLGKADYTKGFIIDFRVENETADGISVVDGTEKDGIADRNYIFQVEKFLGKWMLKSNIIQTVNKSDLDGSDKVVNDLTISLGLTSDAPPILKTSAVTGEGLDDLSELITRLDERTSSKRARNRQQLLMAHENILTANPHFEAVLDRMSEEGLTLDAALRELNERPN